LHSAFDALELNLQATTQTLGTSDSFQSVVKKKGIIMMHDRLSFGVNGKKAHLFIKGV